MAKHLVNAGHTVTGGETGAIEGTGRRQSGPLGPASRCGAPVWAYALMPARQTPTPWSQISDQCGQFMHKLPKSDPKLRTGRNFDD
jgi:hypothetical protein